MKKEIKHLVNDSDFDLLCTKCGDWIIKKSEYISISNITYCIKCGKVEMYK